MEINKTKEQTEFSKKVGLAEWKVLKFNPTRSELNEILGKEAGENDQEIDYTSTSNEGRPTIRVSAWIQDVNTGYTCPLTFFLEDVDVTSSTGKTQFVNAVGKTSYQGSEATLGEWFKKAMLYRVAKKGEAELMEFVRNWLQDIELNVDKGGNRNNILLDLPKIFKGNLKELNDLVESEFAGTVVATATVRTKMGEDGPKYYQSIYNKHFLPGYCLKYFAGSAKGTPKFVVDFIEEMKGPYGPKDFFTVEMLRDYKEGENPVSTDSAVLRPDAPTY